MQLSASVSIVIADDHAMVREGLVAICQSRPELKVVGECADGLAAVEMIRSLAPDFALLDNNMPRLSGIEAVRQLKQSGCQTRLLIVSMSRDYATVQEALGAGADGYILKDGPSRHLAEAIQYVLDGGVYVSPLVERPVATGSPAPVSQDRLRSLSPREYQVFCELVSGRRAKDIASALHISPKTVDTHRASLMRKLNVADMFSLIKLALERNRGA